MKDGLQQRTVLEVFVANERAPRKAKLTDFQLADALVKKLGDKAYLRNIANLRAMYNRGVLPHPKDGKAKPPKIQSFRYDWDGSTMKKNARYHGRTREEYRAWLKENGEAAKPVKAKLVVKKGKNVAIHKLARTKAPVAASKKGIKSRPSIKKNRPVLANAPGKNRSGNPVGAV